MRRVWTGSRRGPGDLEREVLATVAAAGRPLTPAEVLDGLGRELAYTTVMTTLARLHDKGALVRERRGRAFAYAAAGEPAAVAAALTARQMRRLLDGDQDRAGVLARFVAELDPADERTLTALLEEAGGRPAGDR